MSIARTDTSPPADAEFLSAAQVKARYGGVSDMWIVRKLADHEFPAPQTFGQSTHQRRSRPLKQKLRHDPPRRNTVHGCALRCGSN
jgi:hypothetical protein